MGVRCESSLGDASDRIWLGEDCRLGGKRESNWPEGWHCNILSSLLFSTTLSCPCCLRSLSCFLASTWFYTSSVKNWNITTTVHIDPHPHKPSYKLQELRLQTEAHEAVGPWCSSLLHHKMTNICILFHRPTFFFTSVPPSSLITTLSVGKTSLTVPISGRKTLRPHPQLTPREAIEDNLLARGVFGLSCLASEEAAIRAIRVFQRCWQHCASALVTGPRSQAVCSPCSHLAAWNLS